MNIESVRSYCLSLPATTEDIQWGDDLLFRVGKKIYASIGLNPAAKYPLSFKCLPETFAELLERQGIVRAAYIGRYHWVAVRFDALREAELKELIGKSYELVFSRLPRKLQARLVAKRFARKKSA